jgi:D-alanine--poly(phosphoribitol) ligase subunit 1
MPANSMNCNLAWPFYRNVIQEPDATALVVGGQSVSYLDLGRRACTIARGLRTKSCAENRRVLLIGGRTIETYAALLGISWAGCAYIPVSPHLPAKRLRQILEIVQPGAIVADGDGLLALGAEPGADVLALGSDMPREEDRILPEPTRVQPDEPVYIIFTSGSTGVPKGVVNSAGAVRHYINMLVERYRMDRRDRVAQPCELTFDVSVSNIFTAWHCGASLHVVPASEGMAPADFIRRERISFWFSTPATAVFLQQMKMLRPDSFPSLRSSLFAGECLPGASAEAWQRAAPQSIVENLYGPTEATVVCIGQRYTGEESLTPNRGVVASGTALAGMQAAILDKERRELPAGESGQLAVAGPQLAIGYWNDPELTSRKFPLIGGTRWYLTGDLVYRDRAGVFHHLGRLDNQVKLRGYRIELDEIEAHLREICRTDAVVALAWPLVHGSVSGIAAFVSGGDKSPVQIRQELKTRLPSYMVPARIRRVDQMPLAPSGKFDRKALAAMLSG